MRVSCGPAISWRDAIRRPCRKLSYLFRKCCGGILGTRQPTPGWRSPIMCWARMRCCLRKRSFPNAKALASRALELDSTLAEAYTARAIASSFWEFNWSAAEQDFRRAIASDPNSEPAHHWFAEHWLNVNKVDRALAEMERAREVDPLSLPLNAALARVYRDVRRYAQAVEQCSKTLDLDANTGMGQWCLEEVYIGEHLYARA